MTILIPYAIDTHSVCVGIRTKPPLPFATGSTDSRATAAYTPVCKTDPNYTFVPIADFLADPAYADYINIPGMAELASLLPSSAVNDRISDLFADILFRGEDQTIRKIVLDLAWFGDTLKVFRSAVPLSESRDLSSYVEHRDSTHAVYLRHVLPISIVAGVWEDISDKKFTGLLHLRHAAELAKQFGHCISKDNAVTPYLAGGGPLLHNQDHFVRLGDLDSMMKAIADQERNDKILQSSALQYQLIRERVPEIVVLEDCTDESVLKLISKILRDHVGPSKNRDH